MGAATLPDRLRLFRPQLRITLAGPGEAAAIAGLYGRAWAVHAGKLDQRLIADHTPTTDEVSAWLRGGFEVFTASLDGALAGVVRCSFPTGTCLVDRMAVDPDRISQGIERALAEHAIARARRAGVTKVWVQAPPKLVEMVDLYRALGFRESAHLRAHYWGEDVTLLELPL